MNYTRALMGMEKRRRRRIVGKRVHCIDGLEYFKLLITLKLTFDLRNFPEGFHQYFSRFVVGNSQHDLTQFVVNWECDQDLISLC